MLLLGLVCWASSATAPITRAAEAGRIAIVFTPHEMYGATASALESVLTSKNYTCVRVQLPEAVTSSAWPTSTAPAAKTPESPARASSETAAAPAPATAPADAGVREAIAQITRAQPTVVVTVGASATMFVLGAVPDKPLIFCMVPNALDMPFMAADSPQRSRLTGVTTDVAPEKQIEWVVRLHKGCRKLGVLYSSRSERTAKAIVAPAQAHGLTAILIESGKDEFPAAIEALDRQGCDGVL